MVIVRCGNGRYHEKLAFRIYCYFTTQMEKLYHNSFVHTDRLQKKNIFDPLHVHKYAITEIISGKKVLHLLTYPPSQSIHPFQVIWEAMLSLYIFWEVPYVLDRTTFKTFCYWGCSPYQHLFALPSSLSS